MLYLFTTFTCGLYILIPTCRKLLTDNVDPKLFGSLYAIPALIEGVGFPIGGIIYSKFIDRALPNESDIAYII